MHKKIHCILGSMCVLVLLVGCGNTQLENTENSTASASEMIENREKRAWRQATQSDIEELFVFIADENDYKTKETKIKIADKKTVGEKASSPDGSTWSLFAFDTQEEAEQAFDAVESKYQKQKEAWKNAHMQTVENEKSRVTWVHSDGKKEDKLESCFQKDTFIIIAMGNVEKQAKMNEFRVQFVNYYDIQYDKELAEDETVQNAFYAMENLSKEEKRALPMVQQGTTGFMEQFPVVAIWMEESEPKVSLYTFEEEEEAKKYIEDAKNYFKERGYWFEKKSQAKTTQLLVTSEGLGKDENDFYAMNQTGRYVFISSGAEKSLATNEAYLKTMMERLEEE